MKKLIKFVSLTSLIAVMMLIVSSPLIGSAQDDPPVVDTTTVVPTELALDTPEPTIPSERPL